MSETLAFKVFHYTIYVNKGEKKGDTWACALTVCLISEQSVNKKKYIYFYTLCLAFIFVSQILTLF